MRRSIYIDIVLIYLLLLDFGGEESVGILGVELESFADVGPAHGARWEREACMAAR